MVYNIIYIAIWIISILVTVNLFEYISKWIYNIKTENDINTTNTIIIRDNQENIEYIIRRILFAYNLNFENCNLFIVHFNLSINDETKKICSIISRNFDYVKFINT